MHLIQIPPDAVINGESPLQTMWPMIAPLLQRAVDHSDGLVTLEETLQAIIAKQYQLWVLVTDEKAVSAAAVTKLQKFHSGVVQASVILLGGEDGSLVNVLEFLGDLEKWAKTEGCSRVQFYARKGWAKHMPEYKLAKYVMSKDL